MKYRTLSAIELVVIMILLVSLVGCVYYIYAHHGACEKVYLYLNRAAVCGAKEVLNKRPYTETRYEVEQYIERAQQDGLVSDVGVYFRDLERGPIFGVNESIGYAPASLLKLPLAFVFLASAESQPALLEHTVTITGTGDSAVQQFPPQQSAQIGGTYTLSQLLELMIEYSDNTAYEALEYFILKSEDRLQIRHTTFQEIGMINPVSRVEETVTVRNYASLFRLLYNASYLTPEYSEKLLEWLVASDFPYGIEAGVPDEISVANKFGERLLQDGTKQLHDCGIVYYPQNPYILCIMTKGDDWEELESVIASISRMVWDEVEARKL